MLDPKERECLRRLIRKAPWLHILSGQRWTVLAVSRNVLLPAQAGLQAVSQEQPKLKPQRWKSDFLEGFSPPPGQSDWTRDSQSRPFLRPCISDRELSLAPLCPRETPCKCKDKTRALGIASESETNVNQYKNNSTLLTPCL